VHGGYGPSVESEDRRLRWAQVGYNHQVNQLVFGVEADGSFTFIRGEFAIPTGTRSARVFRDGVEGWQHCWPLGIRLEQYAASTAGGAAGAEPSSVQESGPVTPENGTGWGWRWPLNTHQCGLSPARVQLFELGTKG
jgi:hypothetical protein